MDDEVQHGSSSSVHIRLDSSGRSANFKRYLHSKSHFASVSPRAWKKASDNICWNPIGQTHLLSVSVSHSFEVLNLQAWGKSVGAEDKVLLLADGSGQFAKALGVELDLVDKGLGIRSRR
jgi:hypothetical protein